MIRYIVTFFTLCALSLLNGNSQNTIKSYIIQIEDGKAYLDATASKVKVGDVFSVFTDAGYMIHPVTKQQIKKEGKILADLEIVETYEEYSVATVYPEDAIMNLKTGMIAEMPELSKDYNKNNVSYEEENEKQSTTMSQPLNVSFNDTDAILNRYLEVTGLEKWMNSSYIPPFYKKEEIAYTTKKGKIEVFDSYLAVDVSAHKRYLKIDSPKDNILLSYSKALAINGLEGWFKFKNGMTIKLKKKQLEELWNEGMDIFGLSLFDKNKYEYVFEGSRYVNGKNCVIVRFISKVDRKKADKGIIVCFDKNTGLMVSMENSDAGIISEIMEYHSYSGLLLGSKVKNIYVDGKIKEEVVTLLDLCIDCPLDNSLFTKEGVKNAFNK